ncbi:MAG: CheR family methyltransferase [Archangium sp.]|nr:CheR family methyltransferase [Archangium sp.]
MTAAAGAAEADWKDRAFLARLVDELPIDESSLFRNELLWQWLAAELPAWLDASMGRGRTFRALSLGCSSGQEVFSVAMLLVSELRRRGVLSSSAAEFARVWGIDASEARINTARLGAVRAWSVHRSALQRTHGYLSPDAEDPTRFLVDPSVRALTFFERRNLLELVENPSDLGGHGLVLCQHVLVYFREETAVHVLRRLAQGCDPGTVIVLSPVEAHLFTQVDELERLPYVGAARRRGLTTATLPPALRSTPRVAPAPAPARAIPAHDPHAAAEAYVRQASELVAAQRFDEALTAARAACFEEPGHLVARFLVGQTLLSIDAPQGRRVLRELSLEVARLEPGTSLPSAVELSVEQLASAVRLLLGEAP